MSKKLLDELYDVKVSGFINESAATAPTLYNPNEDNRVRTTSDTRKNKLTLKHLNQLNQFRRVREKELAAKLKRIATVYAPSSEQKLDELTALLDLKKAQIEIANLTDDVELDIYESITNSWARSNQ